MRLSGNEEGLASAATMAGPGPDPDERSLRAARLPLGRKIGYGAGQLVELTVESMLNVFMLFYATVVCGLPGGLAGLAIGAGIVVDAIMNPLIGSLSDGWRSRFGSRVPFMAMALAPIILTFNLIFSLPSGLEQTALFLWLMLLSVSLRISSSMFTVPYQALGAELTDDYNERSSVAAWRWGIGILGTVAVIVLSYGVFFAGPGGAAQRDAYLPLTLSLSALLFAGGLIAIRQGLTAPKSQRKVEAPTRAIHLRLLGEIGEMFRNRTFRILFAAALLFNIGAGVHLALGLHVATFFWQLSSTQIQWLGIASVTGLMLGAPLAGPLYKHMEKRAMLVVSILAMVGCNALPASFKLLGLLQLTGDALIGFLAVVAFVGGVMMALSIIAFLSIIPDAADEHEHLFGSQRQGLFFAGWSFAKQSATGAGILFAGLVLQIINFSAQPEQGAAVEIPERTLAWLALAHGPGAGLFAIVGIALMLLYRIDRRSHARIIDALTEHRGAGGG
ncbi:MFS transporter [Parasphingorhabdus sp.]|uniref:MFS transporter n=1 Tax=Parasphingorhabdus sp. TaxID=2709688 RepID=UPI002F92BB06